MARRREHIITTHNLWVAEAEMEFVQDLIEEFSRGGFNKIKPIDGIEEDHDSR
ncbi:MAG: hypothetical protein JRI46_05145 [Deltaproteobacteria bacterium]|nr:hypothetical protein [Deltaproteobacteria bacterium]